MKLKVLILVIFILNFGSSVFGSTMWLGVGASGPSHNDFTVEQRQKPPTPRQDDARCTRRKTEGWGASEIRSPRFLKAQQRFYSKGFTNTCAIGASLWRIISRIRVRTLCIKKAQFADLSDWRMEAPIVDAPDVRDLAWGCA